MGAMASQITCVSIVYSTVCSDADQKKTSKLHATDLCEGNSSVAVELTPQRASNVENVSIWLRHHGKGLLICQLLREIYNPLWWTNVSCQSFVIIHMALCYNCRLVINIICVLQPGGPKLWIIIASLQWQYGRIDDKAVGTKQNCGTIKPLYNTIVSLQNTNKWWSVVRPRGRGMECTLWVQSVISGLMLGLRPVNEWRHYKVTQSLIGWSQT